MMKLCLILDYYIAHDGKFPTENYVRNFGHKIKILSKKTWDKLN